MHKFSALFHHWEIALLAFLKPLGFWGVSVLAAIDSSSVAIPMDLIIAGYALADRRHFWIYAVLGGLGSSIGALVPFYIGRAGGELFLLKHVNDEKYAQMRARFDRHRWFAVMVPAAMPPPFPFKLFAFGAGVFNMRVLPYMGSVMIGRTVHYFVTALLAVMFGPKIFSLIVVSMRRHALLFVLCGALLTILFLVYVFQRRRRKARTEPK